MLRAKIREPPFKAAEIIDYLFMLSEKPCGPTVPGAFLKSMAWFERVLWIWDRAEDHGEACTSFGKGRDSEGA